MGAAEAPEGPGPGRDPGAARILGALGADVVAAMRFESSGLMETDPARPGPAWRPVSAGWGVGAPESGGEDETALTGPRATAAAMDRLERRLALLAPGCQAACLQGALPREAPRHYLAALIRLLRADRIKTVVEVPGEWLRSAAEAKPDALGVDLDSLSGFTGWRVRGRDDVLEVAGRMVAGGVGLVAASLGRRGAILMSRLEIVEAAASPGVPEDCPGPVDGLAAALAWSLALGLDLMETARLAAAVPAALASSDGPPSMAGVLAALARVAMNRLA
jgi:fructose-1-phosphate kinase PfkB-like protein